MLATVKQLEFELVIAALDVARIGLCVFDGDGLIVIANNEFAKKINIDPAQLINRTVAALSDSDILINHLRDLVSLDAEEIATEGRFRNREGQTDVLLFQARTLDHGDLGRYRVVSVVDITNFGITRDRYLELRRQLDALNSSVVLVDVSLESMPILYVNKRFEEMTGYSSAEAVGRNCSFLQRDNKNQPGIAKLRTAISNRQSCQVVLENYKKDGSAFVNELFISPVYDRTGKVGLYIGLQHELSDRLPPYQNNQ